MMNSIAGAEELQVGAFHEIDHSKLSPDSPVQLKSVRIAMVYTLYMHYLIMYMITILHIQTLLALFKYLISLCCVCLI